MRLRARSAKPPSCGSKSGCQAAMRQALLRGSGPELRPARPDGAQALAEPGPRPRLDFPVAGGRLPTRGLEVLEPGVSLLDEQELFGFKRSGHGCTPHV